MLYFFHCHVERDLIFKADYLLLLNKVRPLGHVYSDLLLLERNRANGRFAVLIIRLYKILIDYWADMTWSIFRPLNW
jgi:hypothetical protein